MNVVPKSPIIERTSGSSKNTCNFEINERLLVIIPARGGSKRLPRKNARLLGGIPLIVWSINIAINFGKFCDVLLSTDDEEIASIGRKAGALVPWLRPDELASDTATSGEVLHHALKWYEAERGTVDAVILLQPTSPLRRNDSLVNALQLFLNQPKTDDRRNVVSVSPSSSPPEWIFHINPVNGALHPIIGWSEINKRSQDLQTAYQLNGSIYIVSSQVVRDRLPLISPGSLGIIMDGVEEAIDIDTEDDWRFAESFLPL